VAVDRQQNKADEGESQVSKRPSLIDDLKLAGSPAAPAEPAPAAKAKARPEVVHTSIYIPRPAHRKLREIAYTTEVKIHDLIMEGIDAVLIKHGHPPLAKLKATPSK
jgi:hypothetical protein